MGYEAGLAWDGMGNRPTVIHRLWMILGKVFGGRLNPGNFGQDACPERVRKGWG